MHWVIGDVHGMLDPLRRLIDEIDAVDAQRELIFAGDYVNRGPDSRGVIDLLLQLPNVHCVRGNHDDVFELVLSAGAEMTPGPRVMEEAINALRWFVRYGLDRTIEGYGLDELWIAETIERPALVRLRELHDTVPAAHRSFLAQLPLVFEHPDFIVMHGRWDPLLPTFDPTPLERLHRSPDLRQNVIWGRFTLEEVAADKAWDRPLFFGHTPVHEYLAHPNSLTLQPITGPRVTLLDTGCVMIPAGRLTAVCVENGRVLQVERDGEVVRP